jgi:hypothetical protein
VPELMRGVILPVSSGVKLRTGSGLPPRPLVYLLDVAENKTLAFYFLSAL